ncbi:MAG: hypothetical protein KBT46_00405 [Ruminococcus sp.]|nr:hypothetical protein [Candidatus Copronaster equi]
MKQIAQSRPLSKAELVKVLITKVEGWIADGISPEEAIERLTVKQYDFLIDQNVDLDKYLLTEEQISAGRKICRAHRSCSPNGYNKKYPQSKQDLYNGLCNYILSQGAQIKARQKQNYRDLDFTIGDTAYKIVLSNPRT